ncbi:MAG TPA: HAD family phosphatase [Streptosporangiaceae bacterium]|nr:HAD family phosphatase [Streptosporangiaceae bacterium]
MAERSAYLRAVIFDWGGVITSPIVDTVTAWLETERIDRDSYMAAMRPWVRSAYGPGDSESPIHALERGEMSDEEFEATLAAALVREDGTPVHSVGLLRRMFGASVILDQMLELIKDLRTNGVLTSLLSNSWGGSSDGYPRHLFADLFDDVVISGEVGMRKPEERIFQLAATRLGLSPAECVFVDDVDGNIVAAQALGFTAVLHEDPLRTRAALSQLFAERGNLAS